MFILRRALSCCFTPIGTQHHSLWYLFARSLTLFVLVMVKKTPVEARITCQLKMTTRAFDLPFVRPFSQRPFGRASVINVEPLVPQSPHLRDLSFFLKRLICNC